jgi:hypothetical protein
MSCGNSATAGAAAPLAVHSIRSFVMPGLVPGIHAFVGAERKKTWMAGTSPAMTTGKRYPQRLHHKSGLCEPRRRITIQIRG